MREANDDVLTRGSLTAMFLCPPTVLPCRLSRRRNRSGRRAQGRPANAISRYFFCQIRDSLLLPDSRRRVGSHVGRSRARCRNNIATGAGVRVGVGGQARPGDGQIRRRPGSSRGAAPGRPGRMADAQAAGQAAAGAAADPQAAGGSSSRFAGGRGQQQRMADSQAGGEQRRECRLADVASARDPELFL